MINSDFIRQLYEKEAEHLYYYVKKMVEDGELAQDIVQEVFCVAMRKKKLLIEHPEPEGWLYRTAKNVILSECRKKKKRDILYCYEEMEDLLRDEQAEAEFALAEESNSLYDILSESECEIIKLVHVYGYTTKEAASKLSINENTLRVKMLRIRKKLEYIKKSGR